MYVQFLHNQRVAHEFVYTPDVGGGGEGGSKAQRKISLLHSKGFQPSYFCGVVKPATGQLKRQLLEQILLFLETFRVKMTEPENVESVRKSAEQIISN